MLPAALKSVCLNFKISYSREAIQTMTPAEQKINHFLVDVFNDVLHLEEDSIAKGPYKNLSVSEMHVLEAVQNGERAETMSELAARLRVTASTLTVAVKTLEQKGFLLRLRDSADKRKVTVQLTDRAEGALRCHAAFHKQLIEQVSARLTEQQMEALANMLSTLHTFFTAL